MTSLKWLNMGAWFSALLLVACDQSAEPLPGVYASDVGKLHAGWNAVVHNTYLPMGNQLELNPDSTFVMTTCGNRMTGTWTADADSLYLVTLTNQWKSDSLQEHGFHGHWPTVGSGIDSYYRAGSGELIRVEPFHDQPNKRWKIILEKVK